MSFIHVEFPCDDITLEGEFHVPEGEGPFPAVIVCHPHSLYGGNMLNNIIVAICEVLCQNSVAALRFNLRGVGKSGGKFGGGLGEQEDIKSALNFVSSMSGIDPQKVGLAGYSFGGSVALPVALEDERVQQLALVAPALSESGWEQLKEYPRPKLVIVGQGDSGISHEWFQVYIKEEVLHPAQYEIIPGADHFWWGYEEEVARKVTQFFVDGFSGKSGK